MRLRVFPHFTRILHNHQIQLIATRLLPVFIGAGLSTFHLPLFEAVPAVGLHRCEVCVFSIHAPLADELLVITRMAVLVGQLEDSGVSGLNGEVGLIDVRIIVAHSGDTEPIVGTEVEHFLLLQIAGEGPISELISLIGVRLEGYYSFAVDVAHNFHCSVVGVPRVAPFVAKQLVEVFLGIFAVACLDVAADSCPEVACLEFIHRVARTVDHLYVRRAVEGVVLDLRNRTDDGDGLQRRDACEGIEAKDVNLRQTELLKLGVLESTRRDCQHIAPFHLFHTRVGKEVARYILCQRTIEDHFLKVLTLVEWTLTQHCVFCRRGEGDRVEFRTLSERLAAEFSYVVRNRHLLDLRLVEEFLRYHLYVLAKFHFRDLSSDIP